MTSGTTSKLASSRASSSHSVCQSRLRFSKLNLHIFRVPVIPATLLGIEAAVRNTPQQLGHTVLWLPQLGNAQLPLPLKQLLQVVLCVLMVRLGIHFRPREMR